MRRWLLPTGALAVVVGMAAAYWFQPWRLLTTTEVHEAVPQIAPATALTSAPPTGPATPSPIAALVAEGRFVSHEHATTGTAQLVRLPTGTYQLILRDLDTSDGPDLRVWLTDQPVGDDWYAFDDGRHVELGRLKGNRGTQVYDVPTTVDVSGLRSVTVWCKRFAVSFGAAQMT